jgi:histidine phosphotransferase ChpT
MLDPSLKDVLLNGLSGGEHVEPRAAGAWLAHSLAAEAGGQIRLMEPSPEVLVIGALLPGHAASPSSGQD